jgi:hypothetical protein
LIIPSACSTVSREAKSLPLNLSFPVFPPPIDASGKTIPVLEDGRVVLPLSYWLKITEYAVDMDGVRRRYESWKDIAE